eukprot:scpid101586/ scgid2285/ 
MLTVFIQILSILGALVSGSSSGKSHQFSGLVSCSSVSHQLLSLASLVAGNVGAPTVVVADVVVEAEVAAEVAAEVVVEAEVAAEVAAEVVVEAEVAAEVAAE